MQFRHSSIPFGIVFLLFSAATAAWPQSFSVSATPQTLNIHPGDQNIPLTVNISDSSYSGPISITLSGLPSGITVMPLTLTAGGSGTVELNASVFADSEDFPAADPNGPFSVSNTVAVLAAAGTTQASTTITLTVSISNPSFAPAAGDINLPIVKINTDDGAPPPDDKTKVPGTITITSADGQTVYLSNATGTFHVHGNSTAAMPKKAYNVKLDDSLDLLNAMGLTCPYQTGSGKPTCDKSKSYILLANYDDKTLLRDWSASALANAIPMGNGYLTSPPGSPSPSGTSELMPWAPHSLFVELYLNGQYEGNYQLIEKITADSHRVNIEDNDTSEGTDIGYLLEMDQRHDEDYYFQTPQGLFIGTDDPDSPPDQSVPEQPSYISDYVDQAENALFSPNFTDPKLGWRHYFDEASAVNFYIVNDVMGNQDGGDFYSSVYLYKDKANPLLYMGPVWDFDSSAGNVSYVAISNPTAPWMQTQAVWYVQLFKDPSFKAAVTKQFDALKSNGIFANWLNSISQQAAKLQQSEANNFKRWPILGIKVWPNAEAAGSYNGELNYMLAYLKLRIAYLDSALNEKSQTSTTMNIANPIVSSGSPITLDAHVTATKAPTGTVTFLLNGLAGPVATLDSGGNASVTVSDLPIGSYNLSAVYSGDDHNALSSSSTTGISVQPPLIATTTSIATSDMSVESGTSVTFTASVTGTSGTTDPSGTLTFTSNGTVLGTATLASGSATFTTKSLPAGDDSVEASYSGDGNYQVSSSPELAMAVVGIALYAAPTSATVRGGEAATFQLTVDPKNGYSEAVQFACSDLPAGDSCSFSPTAVAIARGAATSTLTISTAPLAAADIGVKSGIDTWMILTGGIACTLTTLLIFRRRAWPTIAFTIMVAASLAATGCGSPSDPPQQQTYLVKVIASGRTASQATVLNLTVTN